MENNSSLNWSTEFIINLFFLGQDNILPEKKESLYRDSCFPTFRHFSTRSTDHFRKLSKNFSIDNCFRQYLIIS